MPRTSTLSRAALVLALTLGGAALAQPVNDLCTSAEVLTVGAPGAVTTSSVAFIQGTANALEAPFSCFSTSTKNSVWYRFTAPAYGTYRVDTCNPQTNYDTVIQMYAGSSCGGLIPLSSTNACNDTGTSCTPSNSSSLNLTLSPGTYYVQVAAYSSVVVGPTTSTALSVSYTALATQAANDLCSTATTLTPSATVGTTVSAPTVNAINTGIFPETSQTCSTNVKNDLWYAFVPAVSGPHRIDTCGASTNYDTTVALYTGTCGSLVPVSGACNDQGGCTPTNSSSFIANLVAGTTYYAQVAATSGVTLSGTSTSSLNVTPFAFMDGDHCSTAPSLSLNAPVVASTAATDAGLVPAQDDARIDGGIACFVNVFGTDAGVGNTNSVAPGRDISYQFRAPSTGRYSFRVNTPTPSTNAVLYLTDSCQPVSTGPGNYVPPQCLAASDRTTSDGEQVSCVPLNANQTVFVWVDERTLSTSGSVAALEVTPCTLEVESNDSPATASPLACVMTGAMTTAADVDFFALGAHPPGSRVFAMADGLAANPKDFDLRVTTETNTLEYDDANLAAAFGDASPVIAGTILNGLPSYLRVNYYNGNSAAEPYVLYSHVQYGQPTPEVEPNNTFAAATSGPGNNYFTGTIVDGGSDVDFFSFTANAGEVIFAALDAVADRRDAGVSGYNFQLSLFDPAGAAILTSDDTSTLMTLTPLDGGLTASGPAYPADGLVYRARVSGTYGIRIGKTAGVNPNAYVLSVSTGCQDLAPTLDTVSPTAGSPAGGADVTLTGSGFSTRSVVRFGANVAQIVSVTPTQLVVKSPVSNNAGDVDVSVTNGPGLVATKSPGFTYDDPPGVPPLITSVSPTVGPVSGGTVVTINGSVFRPDAGVLFDVNGVVVPAASVTVFNSSRLTATTPVHAEGIANVTVFNTDDLSFTLDAGFTFQGPPEVSAITPNFGLTSGGQTITLDGRNFRPATTVRIGGTLATGVVIADGGLSMTAVTPTSAVNGLVDVIVRTTDGQSVTLDGGFRYDFAAPRVTAISPTFGRVDGGTSVTITGANFLVDAGVLIGGNAASSIVRVSGTSITAVTPPGVPGLASVVVTNYDNQSGTFADGGGFEYRPAALVTSITPQTGFTTGGETVTIAGANFRTGATVRFGTTSGTSVSIADGGISLTVVTPSVTTSGAVDVTVTNPDTGEATVVTGGYLYTYRAPTITAVTPASGFTAGNTAITITGTGFQLNPTVTVGGAPATSVTRTSLTSITARTPAGTPGLADVVVTNSDGQSATSAQAFRYVPPPVLTSIAPNHGPVQGGTLVSLTGQDFLPGATVKLGGVPAFAVTVTSPTTATAVTNANVAGTVDVELINPDTQASALAQAFTFDPAPAVASVSPTTGTTAGGTSVTVTGTGFLSGASVFFGASAATTVTVSSPTQLVAVTPARPSGVVSVTVRNPDGQAMELPRSFRFVDPPMVSAASPNTGDVAGGTQVRITGSGFQAGTTVSFGGTPAMQVSLVSGTELSVVSPPHAPGVVDVVVANDGASAKLTGGFTYTRGAPTLSAVAPVSGPTAGGTLLTLSGTGFAAGATVTLDGVAATDVVVVSDVLARAVVPAHAAGAVDVALTNDDGQRATLAGGFTYVTPPTGSSGTVADGGSGALGTDPDTTPGPQGGVSCGCSSFDASTFSLAGMGLLLVLSRRRRRS